MESRYYLSNILNRPNLYIVSHFLQVSKFILFFKFLSQCDMIVFMKNGTIAEVGTHDELVLNDKDYHNLVNMDHAKQSSSDGTRNLQDMDTSNETNDFAADNIIPNGGCDADTKEFIDNKKESQFDVEEIETLSYSSWSVLLEYFKVSVFV